MAKLTLVAKTGGEGDEENGLWNRASNELCYSIHGCFGVASPFLPRIMEVDSNWMTSTLFVGGC